MLKITACPQLRGLKYEISRGDISDFTLKFETISDGRMKIGSSLGNLNLNDLTLGLNSTKFSHMWLARQQKSPLSFRSNLRCTQLMWIVD
eukprot:jgi/Picre1/28754/NNA_004153.t1